MKQKLWGGAFAEGPDELAWTFGQSIESDIVLWREEIRVSMAHAAMLGQCGIIPREDAESIYCGLAEIEAEALEKGAENVFPADAEDIHAAIEGLLKEKIGDAADKLHAGRSRNDQIATVTRLWLRNASDRLFTKIVKLQKLLLDLGEQHKAHAMPGFTHMQSAQPITLGYHLLAYFWMLERDAVRLKQLVVNASVSPLGSAALAGTSLPVDRKGTAASLGFEWPIPNALDATSDRDFVGDALHFGATLMQHLSRLSQELVLWSTPMYGFVNLGEGFTTGSSIMPQKRNPDMAELIRGRSARVIGHWTAFMSMMRALPLGYNRDQQEDKPPLFDSFNICTDSLELSMGMLQTATFNTERMAAVAGDGFATATGVAEAMVKEGMAFRSAHEATGKLVRMCENQGVTLSELNTDDEITQRALRAATVDGSIASRASYGGPAIEAMDQQLAEAKSALYGSIEEGIPYRFREQQ